VRSGVKGSARSRKLLLASTVALAFFSFLIGVRLRRYAYTIAWHCTHKNPALIGEHRIELPMLWWEEKGSGWNDKSLVERDVFSLVRANASNSLDPRITARPASPWTVDATDQELRKSTEAAIVALNQDSKGGSSHSLVTISSRRFTMYCMRDRFPVVGSIRLVSLDCSAAKMHYSFGYSGPERDEKEAEMILSTFE
jgi:hypothetical protein